MSMSDGDVHPAIEELAEDLGEEVGMRSERVLATVEAQTGIDLADVEDEDAEAFAEAFGSGDEEKLVEILESYDVDDEDIQRFREIVVQLEGNPESAESQQSSADDSGDDVHENGQSSPSDGGGGMSRREVEKLLDERMDGLADEIVAKVSGGGGGDGGGGQPAQQPQQAGPGGLDPQTQQAATRALIDKFLGDEKGGQAAQLGQEVQQQAMKEFVKDLKRPRFGDLLEAQFYERALDSDATEDIMNDLIPSAGDDGDEEEGDMFESLMVEQPDTAGDILERVESGDLSADEAREEVGESGNTEEWDS